MLNPSPHPCRKAGRLSALALFASLVVLSACQSTSRGFDPAEITPPAWPANPFASANPQSLDSYPRDERGVIQVDYGERYDNAGVQYNPQLVARYAHMLYAKMLETEDPDGLAPLLEDFSAQIDWLLRNEEDRGGFSVWTYDFPNPFFDAPAGWVSGMAQGFALSAFVEAHGLTGDGAYLEAASRALGAFEHPPWEGGVRTGVAGSGSWYEEVAAPGTPSSKILNGHIFALSGIQDYYRYTGDERARRLFDEGVAAAEALLPRFDGEKISYYDLVGGDAPCRYHRLHVRQLRWLFEETGRPIFDEYAERFDGYDGRSGECGE